MSRSRLVPTLTSVPTVTDLEAVSVLGLSNGEYGFVDENGFVYFLQKSSRTPDGNLVLSTFDDPSRRWIEVAAASGAGVTSFNGATGVVEYFPQLSVATATALAAVPTLGGSGDPGFGNGQRAWVVLMRTGGGPGEYILQDAISSTPDNFYVVATFDDPTRQWVYSAIVSQGTLFVYTTEIDLTQLQTIQVLPPVNYKFNQVFSSTQVAFWVVTAKDGTITTGPTSQLGTNATINDLSVSQVQAITATPLNAQGAMIGVASPFGLDMSTHGVRLQITSGAVLGTATSFKAKIKLPLNITRQ